MRVVHVCQAPLQNFPSLLSVQYEIIEFQLLKILLPILVLFSSAPFFVSYYPSGSARYQYLPFPVRVYFSIHHARLSVQYYEGSIWLTTKVCDFWILWNSKHRLEAFHSMLSFELSFHGCSRSLDDKHNACQNEVHYMQKVKPGQLDWRLVQTNILPCPRPWEASML